MPKSIWHSRAVSLMVKTPAHNRDDVGSSPTRSTFFPKSTKGEQDDEEDFDGNFYGYLHSLRMR